MLMQTNAYSVPLDKRDQHEKLVRKFAEAMRRVGATFEVYEQVGPSFNVATESTGRFVQVIRFRDKHHLQHVQAAERADPTCQAVIAEFCEAFDIPLQREKGLFLPGYYAGLVARGEEVH